MEKPITFLQKLKRTEPDITTAQFSQVELLNILLKDSFLRTIVPEDGGW